MNKEVKIFYTSDWHFGHKNIIRYCNRPFDLSDEGVAQCTDFIKKEYCSVVGPDDFVFFLVMPSLVVPRKNMPSEIWCSR